MIVHSPCPPVTGTLTNLSQWLCRRCNQEGLESPQIILWPGCQYTKFFDGGTWTRPSSAKSSTPPKIPGGINSFPYYDSTWLHSSLSPDYLKEFHRKTVFPCRLEPDLIAVVAFDVDKDDSDEIEIARALGAEFEDAIERLSTVEILRARVRGLQACLNASDRAFAVATANGHVLAATNEARQVLGKILYGSAFSSFRDQRITELPDAIRSELGSGHSQVRIDEFSTAAIDSWREGAISTMPPLCQVVIHQEASGSSQPLPISILTHCEKLVFDLLVTGQSNKQIALERRCSISTIRHQVAAVFHKMKIHKREQLIAAYHSKRTPQHVPGLGAVEKVRAPFIGQVAEVRRYVE